MDYYLFLWPLLVGFALDCLIGDPHWLPHPVRLFGWLIAQMEKKFNRGKFRKLKGALGAAFLVGLTWLFMTVLFLELKGFPIVFFGMATVGVFWGIAGRSLIVESRRVLTELRTNGIEAARIRLSYIVGRDTGRLDEQQIRTAVLETMAENLSDGVIAPLFFYALGGVPLLMAFKMASTLDSMIAYKDSRYRYYGWLAARMDDLLNLIPSRLTVLLMALSVCRFNGLRSAAKFGHRHSSPNAGYPEATLAGILHCRFGGPNVYHGELVCKPYIGEKSRVLSESDFRKAVWINKVTSLLMLFLIVGIVWLIH